MDLFVHILLHAVVLAAHNYIIEYHKSYSVCNAVTEAQNIQLVTEMNPPSMLNCEHHGTKHIPSKLLPISITLPLPLPVFS